jgi:septal ring factor EnvC (AmiA/AmiB activator)
MHIYKMSFFNFLRKKRKATIKRKRRRKTRSLTRRPIARLSTQVDQLKGQIATVNIALKKHDDELSRHSKIIAGHSEKLRDLEQMVQTTKVHASEEKISRTGRPTMAISPPAATNPPAKSSPPKFDINRFSEQEKKILAVFFQNRGMNLSYADVAHALNKSSHTIKNQMNRMRLKADLFDKAIGDQSRNRFKLKDGLRIEKYLNVG